MTADAGSPERRQRLAAIAMAGHRADLLDAAVEAITSHDADERELALGALHRAGALSGDQLAAALHDPAAQVRRRAAVVAARLVDVRLLDLLPDPDDTVTEAAAFACGERADECDDTHRQRLIQLAGSHDNQLVREACVAALGAIGHPDGLAAILAGCADKPAVRRRAVLALAPFDGPEVDAAIDAALVDRDWQVRQAAEDLRRAQSLTLDGGLGDT